MVKFEDFVEGESVVYRRCPNCNCRTPKKQPVCEECGGRFCVRCHGEGIEGNEDDPVRQQHLITDLADLARSELSERRRAELATRLTESNQHTEREE